MRRIATLILLLWLVPAALLTGVGLWGNFAFSQDSSFIKIHFLYGSKPLPEHKGEEKKWFGGIMGGHTGIEIDSACILNFVPSGKYHLIGNRHNPHGRFALHSPRMFWQVLGNRFDEVKKTTIVLPVSARQRDLLDSLSHAYLDSTPYDYAFLGMRCAAATYELLAQAGIVREWGMGKTWRRIFYPRKLRTRLLELARLRDWEIIREDGTGRRKWEKDLRRVSDGPVDD